MAITGRRRLTKEELGIREDEEQEIFESPGNVLDEDGGEDEREREMEISLMEKELEVGRQATCTNFAAPLLADCPPAGRGSKKEVTALTAEKNFSSSGQMWKRGDYRVLGCEERRFETPVDRYSRLVAGLVERLKTLDSRTNSIPVRDKSAPKSVLDVVENLKKSDVATKTAEQNKEEATDVAHKRDVISFLSLDSRISQLERTLGDGDMAGVYPDISCALDNLEKRLALVEPGTLEAVAKQVNALEQRLQKVGRSSQKPSKPSSQGAEADSEYSQLAGLAETVERWDSVAMTLPTLIQRLRSLGSLHDEASRIVSDVASLRNLSSRTSSLLEAQESAMEKVTASLESNMQVMASNLANLEGRLAKLEQGK
ncbi:hypothetical protein GUITHDRAFT_142947 [Guillardia theta CCMP2712]|uniref:Dynactin subunit 2 n=1 Tax=Guillardia theta (strain CCMP2712) TaxID=905079 RepID=L1IWH2_GUITC|nr:hypothetical protein GUITHDRAFT_142947 [Guillardia theta CCMP2712]EKX40224.1 hypothetical protein GUITHDRAFT_142947 [Guillardia theta CCMP2712]|eukprot:XP_005827204.1 hypothetical protein GUITHDRAFT_142947 [Guillardia theta CCMP2712]